MHVSRETSQKLKKYAALIRRWNPRINLIAPSSIADLDSRHISDSTQLIPLANPDSGSWMDLGSGGGLPGIVVSILTQDTELEVTLVESDQRKSAFLKTVRRELELRNLTVKTMRIERLPVGQHQYLSARALAATEKLLPHISRQLARDGEAWLLKGQSWKEEVEAARRHWRFDLDIYQSATDPASAILKLRNIEQNA